MKGTFQTIWMTLCLLLTVSCNQSGKEAAERAREALMQTIQQDKSGMDVSNDSLLRVAFNWYELHKEDSLYAKCQYYMGKYYMLNDSTEQAIACLDNAVKRARELKDTATICLALEKQSKVMRETNPQKALGMSEEALTLYGQFSGATNANKVYYKLNVAECFHFVDSLPQAVRLADEALNVALSIGNSTAIADAYQDLSNFHFYMGNKGLALEYARRTTEATSSVSSRLVLARAYVNADSTLQARMTLNALPADIYLQERYTLYYIWHTLALKERDYETAELYTDSAFHVLEEMYADQLSAKTSYFLSAMEKERLSAMAENRASLQRVLICFILAVSIVVCLVIALHYRERVRHEKELRERESAMNQRLHEEELHNRDVQISTMRNYLLKKIDIAERIEGIRTDDDSRIVLSEVDWSEMELFLDSVDNLFVQRLRARHPLLTDSDIRLMMLLRLHIPQRALTSIYCVSEKAIKQKLFLYKSKVGIEGEKQSLREYIENF